MSYKKKFAEIIKADVTVSDGDDIMPWEVDMPETVILKNTPEVVSEDFTKDLTEDQVRVFNECVEFVKSKRKMHTIKGYAGTGKTFTTSRLLKWILANTGHRIAMTATTNKAVKVMKQSSIVPANERVVFSTIHSLLGLRENIKADGKIDFVADKTKPRSIESYKILLVDESSMLSDDLFKEINYCLQSGLKVFFIGDPQQIPPVNGDSLYSAPFDEKKCKQYEISCSELTQIVRQKEGSPIIEATLIIRNRPKADNRLIDMIGYDWNKERGGVMMLDSTDRGTNEKVEKILVKLYKSEKFEHDADYVKVIAWRNKTIDYMNSEIRKILYGDKPPVYVIGEKLLANTPIIEEVPAEGGFKTNTTRIIFHTNDEFEIEDIQEMTMTVRGEDMDYYLLTVGYDCYGIKATEKIPVIHKRSEPKLKEVLDLIKTRALSLKHIPDQASATWKEFYAVQRIFADVKYNYAVTAHKSQGSTYENCIVMDTDISMNNNVSERNRIKYTACSRAAKLLVIVS